ncbi:MAG: hypothetical protein B7Y75_07245 [Azorhizobium sp. 35-67-5]|nr:MAG: hypothetical protein B7Y75_07245 [Azorhizobium sp. 35-67-5]
MSRRARTPALGSTIGRWLAAYLVVLQAVLGGLAAGAMAAPATGDAFTLCLSAASSGDASADHGDSAPSTVFHDCNACPLAGGVPLLPDVPTAQSFQAFALTVTAPARSAGIWAPVPLSESARPRAPPRLG